MRNTRRVLGGVLAVVLCLAVSHAGTGTAAPEAPAADAKVTLQEMKYDDLGKLIQSQKGKVVVVDFWATTCPPCVAAFPHVVKMHNQFDKKKVTIITVTVDTREDPEQIDQMRKTILKFLEKRTATMTNVWLDEAGAVWTKKLDVEGVPCMFIFDKDNKIIKKLVAEEYNPTVAENLIEELAKK